MEADMNVPAYYLKHRGLCFMLFAGAALAVGLIGCFQNYGRFSRNAQIHHAFQSGSVPPELNYYYAGRETMPYAIMGILAMRFHRHFGSLSSHCPSSCGK